MEVLGKKEKKELLSNVQFYGMRSFPLRHCALFMGAPMSGLSKSTHTQSKATKNRILSFLPNCLTPNSLLTPQIKSSELAILSS